MFLLCALSISGANASAQSMGDFLNAPGWDISCEVRFKSSDSGSNQGLHGKTTYQRSLDRFLTYNVSLNMRNDGASLSMSRIASNANAAGPEVQQAMYDLVMKTDQMANWMDGGPQIDESLSDEAQMAAMQAHVTAINGAVTLDYTMVTRGTDLVDETGSHYSMVDSKTCNASAPVHVQTGLSMEIDAESKSYLLTLGIGFTDASDSSLACVTVTSINWKGGSPEESREAGRRNVNYFLSDPKITDAKHRFGEIPLFEGSFDPAAGKITGEKTVAGSYTESGVDIPGLFAFKYILTPRK